MNRGERSVGRTRAAIKNALLELLREKNYPDITVGEITARGNVGRSTLYKHYRSKANILADIHRDIFEDLFKDLSRLEAWLAPEPPESLIAFFERARRLGRNPFSLSYKLGSDIDYLTTSINLQLTETVKGKLFNIYLERDLNVPLPILAQAIASLYSGLIMSWFTGFQSMEVREFATCLHELARALVVEAAGGRTLKE